MELVQNPLFARYFARRGARLEEHGGRELRAELLTGLSGRVIEVGAGTGLNFARYPDAVREVVAVEPEPYLRARALAAAGSAPVPVTVVEGTAAALPAADGEFDAVVVSQVLCSVSNVPAALAECSRVLRPGGQLRFWEHVRSRDPLFAGFQRAADLVWPHLMGGCHVQRDSLSSIREVFTVESCRGFRFPVFSVLWPPVPRILGTARKAGAVG
jgi:ubiquinone/menaquinone biosynthesis C-methylase UbiE